MTRPTTPPSISEVPASLASLGDLEGLRSAIATQKPQIFATLASLGFSRPEYFELDLALPELPGVERVCLFAWPEPPGQPSVIGVDVVRLGHTILARSITLRLELAAEVATQIRERAQRQRAQSEVGAELDNDEDETRPAIIRTATSEWRLVRGTYAQEVIALDTTGEPIYRTVDIRQHCYQLACPRCLRVRYARRNSLYQIAYCWVCTRQERLRRRAVSQYLTRARGATPRRRLSLSESELALQLRAERHPKARIARELNCSASTITRFFAREDSAQGEGEDP